MYVICPFIYFLLKSDIYKFELSKLTKQIYIYSDTDFFVDYYGLASTSIDRSLVALLILKFLVFLTSG